MPWTGTTTRSSGFLVTAAVWNAELVDNMTFLEEVNYTTFTADVSITATTVGTANQIVTSGAITYENVPHLIEFYCPLFDGINVNQCFVILRDTTTVIGTIGQIAQETTDDQAAAYFAHRLSPTAASHTYNIAAWNSAAGTSTANAGTGGTAGNATTHLAGYIRITRIPT